MEIILDTNFILTCVKQKIDFLKEFEKIFGVYTLVVPKQVFDELEKIIKNKNYNSKLKEYSKISIQILKTGKIKTIDLDTINTDSGIIRYANRKNVIVASLDRGIKKRIKNKNAKFLTIRNKKRIILSDEKNQD